MNDEDDSSHEASGSWWRRVTQRLAGGPRTRQDLLHVLREACEAELLDQDALQMCIGVLTTDELQVRDIMVPRAQMVVLERDWALGELMHVVIDSGHSRFPVIGESRDEIVGILLAKDLLKYTAAADGANAGTFQLAGLLRPAVFVPESKRVNVLLKDFKRDRIHMAVVVDEYGGIAGLVTIEDVLEQIVGEIDDEYDDAEAAQILRQDERRYLVNGLTTVEDFNEYFHSDFPEEEFDTIGGLVTQAFGHLPKRGESVSIGRFSFNVQRADTRRVQMLQVTVQRE